MAKLAPSLAFKSVLAGMLIGIGGLVYLSVDYKVFGAFLFSLGLITIITKGFTLYTGVIGHLDKINSIPYYFFMLIYNLWGAWVIGLVGKYCTAIDATALVATKLSQSISTLFIMSMICGVLMYLGVSTTKSTNNPLYASMAVMVFILVGAEHCIANIFYLAIGHAIICAETIGFMIVNILGNSLGAILWKRMENIANDS